MPSDRANAMDHVVLVLFENRSFDNLLGYLYEPGEVPSFEGVIGKDLSNPIPKWAEHGVEREVVSFEVATGMDAPNPDPGEEFQHTNTQLFNVLDEHNKFKDATEMAAPFNAPSPGQEPTMDGFVTDYISFFTVQMGRQPTYDEYRQIMTGYTPDQVPVISSIARGFGVFDNWFSEVPSQTMTNRSFWTAATASGLIVNRPMSHFMHHNDAETIFERIESKGKSWKIYVLEPDPVSFTGIIHMSRLRHRFATHFAPFSEFENDCANGTLPDFSLIEPNLMAGHGDYHPAFGRALLQGVDVDIDPPSSILAGEAFLARIYDAVKSAPIDGVSNVYNTTFFIGWDEPGGTYDHVPPGLVSPPDGALPKGMPSFEFDRSGYRVPAIVVSPWVPEKSVFNDEYRHTSMIATLRKVWDLGEPFSKREAEARTFEIAFSLEEPRPPATWPEATPLPVPAYQEQRSADRGAISSLGRHLCHGLLLHKEGLANEIATAPSDPESRISPDVALDIIHKVSARLFPTLSHPHDKN